MAVGLGYQVAQTHNVQAPDKSAQDPTVKAKKKRAGQFAAGFRTDGLMFVAFQEVAALRVRAKRRRRFEALLCCCPY
jgi:hypothetical protein